MTPSFSQLASAGREIAHFDFSPGARNCSASCGACSRSPAPTGRLSLREEHIATLSLLAGDYMELVWEAALQGNAEDFRFWRDEVRRTDMEILALRSEAAHA